MFVVAYGGELLGEARYREPIMCMMHMSLLSSRSDSKPVKEIERRQITSPLKVFFGILVLRPGGPRPMVGVTTEGT